MQCNESIFVIFIFTSKWMNECVNVERKKKQHWRAQIVTKTIFVFSSFWLTRWLRKIARKIGLNCFSVHKVNLVRFFNCFIIHVGYEFSTLFCFFHFHCNVNITTRNYVYHFTWRIRHHRANKFSICIFAKMNLIFECIHNSINMI